MPRYMVVGTLLALATTTPLVWKWRLGVLRSALFVLAVSLVSGLLVGLLGRVVLVGAVASAALVWTLTLIVACSVLAYRFYRDPRRLPPARQDIVVSPADGEVIYVRESLNGVLPVSTKYARDYPLQELTKTALRSRDACVIGISMSFLDVHVNRAPISGAVTLVRHTPGSFGSLRRPEMVFQNERTTMVIENDQVQAAVVQIASRLVRQIVTFVTEGQPVAIGERIGVIRFGSQVDLVLPTRDDLSIVVGSGDRLKAGESIVAVLKQSPDRLADTSGEQLSV